MIELVREKSTQLASLLSPLGMSVFFKEKAEQIVYNKEPKSSTTIGLTHEQDESTPNKMGFLLSSQEKFNTQVSQIEIIQEKIQRAHGEFVNCIIDISGDFFATGGSDQKVNIWSKQTLALIETFDVPGEVASMTLGA